MCNCSRKVVEENTKHFDFNIMDGVAVFYKQSKVALG